MQSGGYIDSTPPHSDNDDITDPWDPNSNHNEEENDGRSSPFERPASPQPPYNAPDDQFGLMTDARDFLTHSSPGTPSRYTSSPRFVTESDIDQNPYSSQESPDYGTASEYPPSPSFNSQYRPDTPAPYSSFDTSVNSSSPDHNPPSDQDDFQGFSSSDNISDQSDEGENQGELSFSTNDEGSNLNSSRILSMSPGFSEFDEASSPPHGPNLFSNNSNHSSHSDLSGALDTDQRAPSVEIISDDDNEDDNQLRAQRLSNSSEVRGPDQRIESSYPASVYLRNTPESYDRRLAQSTRQMQLVERELSSTRAQINALYSTLRDNVTPPPTPPADHSNATPLSTATDSPGQEDLEVLLGGDDGRSQTTSAASAAGISNEASSGLSNVNEGNAPASSASLIPALSPKRLQLLEETYELRRESRKKDVKRYVQSLRRRSLVQNEFVKAVEKEQEKRRQELQRLMNNEPPDLAQGLASERQPKRKACDNMENTIKQDEKKMKLERDGSGRNTPACVVPSSTVTTQVKMSRSLPSATFIPSRDSSPAKRSKVNASATNTTKVEPGETKCTWDKKKLNLSINLAINLDKAKKKRESPTSQASVENVQARDTDPEPSTSGGTNSSKKTEKARKSSTYVPSSGQVNENMPKAVPNSNITRAKADSSSRVGSLERRSDSSRSGNNKHQASQPANVIPILDNDSDSENDVDWEPLGNESSDVSISSSEDLMEPDEDYKVRIPISAAALLEKYQDVDDDDDEWTPS